MDADDIARCLALAAEAKARAIMAEPVPIVGDQLQQRIIDDTNHGNAMAFLTSSRTDIPALATAVEALAAEVRRLIVQRDHARAWVEYLADNSSIGWEEYDV